MATPTINPHPEPAAEPPLAAEAPRLSLKVRTLDQKTYPITICAAASVPQLKEVVAVETGVTLARQRLIYRGRVLKNDQPLAAYSLEDGHVLHLVVRATPPPPADAAARQESAATLAPDAGAGPAGRTSGRYGDVRQILDTYEARMSSEMLRARMNEIQALRSQQRRANPPPTDNDEPDPAMGRPGSGLPSRVLMGATISVPEGTNVTMPFLSSMIANLVTHVHEDGAEGEGTAAEGRRHVSYSAGALGGAPTAAQMRAHAARVSAARTLRRHRRNRDDLRSTGRQRHGRRSSTAPERQENLRARTGLRLASVRATLDDASLDFSTDLTALPQGGDNAAMTELQQQVEMLLTLLERFGPRLRLLPAALAQRDRLTESSTPAASGTAATESPSSSSNTPTTTNDPAEPTVSTRHVIRAIETLQTIGESTDLLARMARHAFVHQSIQLGEPIPRRRDAVSAGNSGADTADDGVTAAMQATGARATTGDGALAAVHWTERSEESRQRLQVARIRDIDLRGEQTLAAFRPSSPAPGSTSGFPVDLTRSSSGTAPPLSQPATSADSGRSDTTQSRRMDEAPHDVNDPLPPAGARISIPGMGGLPIMSSIVFPYTLAAGLGGRHASTTWNLADFVSRLTSELSISTIYGVMAGDATHLHHVLALIGYALFSGVDVPRVSRSELRTWAENLVNELRRLLRSHALPADVLDQVNGEIERRAALGTEVLRVMEPFIPDLIDYLVRATSASRIAAFEISSSTFLRTLAQQVVRRLRSYARGDSTESEDESDDRLKRLLRGLLIWLGMNEHMAGFVVDSLLCWTEGDNTSSRRGRTRQREEATTSDAGATDLPATKRRRE